MGYTKIIKYGDITELFEYERSIKKRTQGIDALKATRLQQGHALSKGDTRFRLPVSQKKKRQQAILARANATHTYTRSKGSIARSRNNFFRLCHHNNCNATTIHFLTLTFAHDLSQKEASGYVKSFMARVSKNDAYKLTRYISVPELTKKGRLHYHLLVYDLPTDSSKKERVTRNFQRQFRQGFLDLRYAPRNSKGIALYMAKYMGKALTSKSLGCKRGYTCSRGINKVTTASSNTGAIPLDMIVHMGAVDKVEKRSYDVPYLGKCTVTKLIAK